jgi:hypothetical protein
VIVHITVQPFIGKSRRRVLAHRARWLASPRPGQ